MCFNIVAGCGVRSGGENNNPGDKNMPMTKKYPCPNCGVAMEFRPDTQMLHCEFCNSAFTPRQMAAMERELADVLKREGLGAEPATPNATNPATGAAANSATSIAADPPASHLMQMTILRCQSCGAELAVSGTEASTFCAFCGQPTVVSDRLEGWLKPDYIIPFTVTKEDAATAIREKLSKGRFIPRKLKNFKAERLGGVYIPHFLFDVYYADDQVWTYKETHGKRTVTKHCRRAAECMFRDVPVDVSLHMPDGASQRLEPYNTNELKPFNAAYLSGFYSDRFDESSTKANCIAVTRASEMFNERMKTELEIDYHDVTRRDSSDSVSEAINRRYALLPAWIMTFHQGGKPYNIMVNGQTGKVSCAVPFLKAKAMLLYVLMLLLFCIPLGLYGRYALVPIFNAVAHFSDRFAMATVVFFFGGLGFAAYFCASEIRRMWTSFRELRSLTNSTETELYITKRQEKSL